MPLVVGDPFETRAFALPGAPGAERAGELNLRIPLELGTAGRRVFAQAFVLDAEAAEGVSASNGLELTIGALPPTLVAPGPR